MSCENKKILVIGGSSLFGIYLIPLLMKEGCEVIATYVNGQEIRERTDIAEYTGGGATPEWTAMDVLDKGSIIKVLKEFRPDIIYDFAVQNSVGRAWKDPAVTVDINVIGGINLFDAVRSIEGYSPRILRGGSGEEYGRADYDKLPMAETLQPKPNNIFASTLVCQDLLAGIYHRAYGMDIITVRTFNEIGPGMSRRFSVADFCSQFAAAHKEGRDSFILHAGNINIERDYTDVRDLVKAYAVLAEKGRAGEIYNAGRGHAVSIRGVIEMLEEISGVKAEIVVDPSRIRPIDTPKFESDCTKIFEDTGWKTEIELKDTIREMYGYYNK